MSLAIEEIRKHSEEKRNDSFTFHFMPQVTFEALQKENIETLTKWGLVPDMQICKFRYEQPLQKADLPAFVESFFKSPDGQGVLRQFGAAILSPKDVRPRFEELAAKQVSLTFLRQLETAQCVSHTGHIMGRIEEDYEGIPLWDKAREALIMEESELYDTFSEADRKEFLFHIFRNVMIGGQLNQYEDYIEPYTSMTKMLYKDFATVRRNDAGDIEVLSWIVKVTDLGPGANLFPNMDAELRNFCYLIVDPMVRHVTLWYMPFKSHWG